ncbi:hypothetical protein TELCIR_20548 [Teladorsagia circumcincta]|uniref:Uncharacterized protein n=1 Tax=Teladorsagia circumcincta TaxID=45464 RepID=A0A2G9TJF2_TELCI|nr:hypothetical protein TELCIR_20548 [Teladorsagia circumcincta]
MADKGVVLTRCRQIAAKYQEFDAIPFDTEVGMVDVILQIPYVTYLCVTCTFTINDVIFTRTITVFHYSC